MHERMMPGEKYLVKQQTFFGTREVYKTNEVHNPCYDITCPNMDCYDHPYNGETPCANPNCGNTNCKRNPCEWNGSNQGLG